MHLVVGLGNPGPRYASHRHNVGFGVVDRLAEASGASFRDKFRGRFAKTRLAGQDVGLLEPLTFMNHSGESVQPAMRFFGVPSERLVVVHDELDLPFGTVRLKMGGGAAGHNGLRSIIQHCGGPDFCRVRVGIGRPPAGPVQKWVLSNFTASESAALEDVLRHATRAVEAVVSEGISAAMNTFNARR
jgi:PTH1 family peptidyl-tRNA hydrolase